MAKRFTDSEKWKDDWFDQLSVIGKLFFFYFTDNCDHAGILKTSIRKFCKDVGAEYSEKEMRKEFGHRVEFLSNGSMFMPNFIKFQYGKLLESNNAHKGVLKSLDYNGIQTSPYLAPAKPHLGGAQDKDKDKDKDNVLISAISVPSPDAVTQLWNDVLASKLGYSRGIGVGEHLKNFVEARQFLKTDAEWRDYFVKISNYPFLLGENDKNWKISLQWAVNYDNALKVLDGVYDKSSSVKKALDAVFGPEEVQ